MYLNLFLYLMESVPGSEAVKNLHSLVQVTVGKVKTLTAAYEPGSSIKSFLAQDVVIEAVFHEMHHGLALGPRLQ